MDLAARYDELAKDLDRIRNSRRHAQLTAALSALDVATRRMLDALPTESKKDSSSTSEPTDQEGTSGDLDAAHNAATGVEPSTYETNNHAFKELLMLISTQCICASRLAGCCPSQFTAK